MTSSVEFGGRGSTLFVGLLVYNLARRGLYSGSGYISSLSPTIQIILQLSVLFGTFALIGVSLYI